MIDMSTALKDLVYVFIWFIAAKAICLGSDFSFINWIRYGKKYTSWYWNRPEFDPDK